MLISEIGGVTISGPCFHCGQTVNREGIEWHGHGGELVFHGECALHFAIRFMRDIHEYELQHRSVVASRKSLDRFPQ